VRWCEPRPPVVRGAGPGGAVDVHELINYKRPLAYGFACDSGGGGPAKVRSQRLTGAPTEIFRMIPRKEQDPAAKLVMGEHDQRALVEVRIQGLSGR
jgi:hypothetical protein